MDNGRSQVIFGVDERLCVLPVMSMLLHLTCEQPDYLVMRFVACRYLV